MADAVRVIGLRDLRKAFATANRGLAQDMRTAIEQAGEPIKQEAQSLIRNELAGMGRSKVKWWTIRVGVERSTIGYIVPATKASFAPRRRYARSKFADRIGPREERALDRNRDRVVDEFDDALTEMAKAWARV